MSRIPVAIAANPTLDDVLIERIERAVASGELPPGRPAIEALVRARNLILREGITQI